MSSDRAPPLKTLICGSLRYCCLWAFFSLYKKPSVVAERLGCHRVSVCRYLARFREGEFKCEGKENCMKKAVRKRKRQ